MLDGTAYLFNKKTDLDNWHGQEKLKLEEHHHVLILEAEKFGCEKMIRGYNINTHLIGI